MTSITMTRQQAVAVTQIIRDAGMVKEVIIEGITSETLKGAVAVVLRYTGSRKDQTWIVNQSGVKVQSA